MYNILLPFKDVRTNKNGGTKPHFVFIYTQYPKNVHITWRPQKKIIRLSKRCRLIHFHRWIVRKITCCSFIFADVATNERILFFFLFFFSPLIPTCPCRACRFRKRNRKQYRHRHIFIFNGNNGRFK